MKALRPQVFQASSRHSLRVIAKTLVPPKRKTGGGGDNNDNNNHRRDERDAANRARMYNIGMLQRAFNSTSNVTPSVLHNAMVVRWGRPYRCSLTHENQYIAIKVSQDPYHIMDEDDDIFLITELLNSYSLGPQFVDYIKYDHGLKDPRYCADFIISLSIPIAGARANEWFKS